MNVSEVLNRAADLIEPDGCWTQGAYARHKNGRVIGPNEKNAVCWCFLGAIRQVSPTGYFNAISALAAILPFKLIAWHDAPERTQQEVVSALRRAAQAQEQA